MSHLTEPMTWLLCFANAGSLYRRGLLDAPTFCRWLLGMGFVASELPAQLAAWRPRAGLKPLTCYWSDDQPFKPGTSILHEGAPPADKINTAMCVITDDKGQIPPFRQHGPTMSVPAPEVPYVWSGEPYRPAKYRPGFTMPGGRGPGERRERES